MDTVLSKPLRRPCELKDWLTYESSTKSEQYQHYNWKSKCNSTHVNYFFPTWTNIRNNFFNKTLCTRWIKEIFGKVPTCTWYNIWYTPPKYCRARKTISINPFSTILFSNTFVPGVVKIHHPKRNDYRWGNSTKKDITFILNQNYHF